MAKHIFKSTTAPTFAPRQVGHHYVNITNGDTYISVGTSTPSDWRLVNQSIDDKVKISASDISPGYLDSELTVSTGTNSLVAIEKSIVNPGADEKLNIQFDESKVTISPSQVTGLTEAVQDAMGSAFTDTSSIDFTYNDAGNTVSASVLPAGVDHNSLANFVANKHIDHSAVTLTAGTGLSGGGDITTSRTFNIANTGVIATTYGSTSQVPVIAVNAQGQLTSVTNTSISIPSTSITDFTEAVQDVVGGELIDTSSIDVTYNDLANNISMSVIPGGVDHNALLNFVANKHIDHSTVSLINGTGISATGLGDLTASRTINLANTSVTASSYGSATQVPTYTVNAQGQLTTAANISIAIPSSQITDFSESVDDRVAALLVAGSGISLSYNDPGNALTVSSSITQYTDEQAQDAVGTILTDSSSIDFTYNDIGNTISATVLPAGVDHNLLTNFVANKHIDHSTVVLNAGTGISSTGLGDITSSRTINIANTTVTAAAYGSATQIPTYSVNAQGQLTAAANVSISIPSTQVSDFNEAAQDAIGGILTDTASIDFTYSDAGNTISATVIPGGVDHNALLNGGGNTHINHASVSILAGTGLSGGGDLTASRTLNLTNTGVTAGTYGSTSLIPVITVDAQGRLTSASSVALGNQYWTVDTDIDPGGLLTWSDQTGQDLAIRQAGASGSPYIRQIRSLGTLASPTAVLSGDRLGGNGYYGWNSTGVDSLPSVALNGYASENHTSTAQGGEFRVEVIQNGTTTPFTAMTIKNNGDVDLSDGILLGNTTDTTNGRMRYDGTEFQIRESGSWKVVSTAPVQITATAASTTTSATFATITSMTSTPAAGTYMVHFTCAAALSASNSTGDFGLFIAGVEQASTRRTIQNGAATAVSSSVAISTLVTVNGSQAITIQFRENSAATLTVNARELILIPISR